MVSMNERVRFLFWDQFEARPNLDLWLCSGKEHECRLLTVFSQKFAIANLC